MLATCAYLIKVGQLSNAINQIEELIEHIKQLHSDILTSVQNQGIHLALKGEEGGREGGVGEKNH